MDQSRVGEVGPSSPTTQSSVHTRLVEQLEDIRERPSLELRESQLPQDTTIKPDDDTIEASDLADEADRAADEEVVPVKDTNEEAGPSIEEKQHRRQRTRSSHVRLGDPQIARASRFTLWETKGRYWLVAYNTTQTRFRVLKIDRTPAGQHSQTWDNKDADRQSTHSAERKGGAGSPPEPKSQSSTSGMASNAASYWDLNVTPDQAVYDRGQITELLDMISEGNRSTGGLKEVGHFFGLVGFIRFTSTYYMVLISRRSVVALVGGHYIYHCDETKILPICHPSVMSSIAGRTKQLEHDEARLLHTFKQVDLGKNFYFSYTYDLTRTLQENLTGGDAAEKESKQTAWGYCEKFIWNHHLLLPAFGNIVDISQQDDDASASNEWVLPLCYGFVDQAKLSVMNRTVHVTLIARRSRHFAGARFLKRGANDAGQVANDVETEQIVGEALTTPFYVPTDGHARRPAGLDSSNDTSFDGHARTTGRSVTPCGRYTSYVMHRGSIPILWTQDSTNMSPRPPIEISVVDPYYSAAALHFDEMFARYGSPIIILNLIKSKEKTPRETKLLHAFGECISYLNQFLPPDKKMLYIAWDMSRASKSRDQDVIGVLEDIAEETVDRTKFFHSGPEPTRYALQSQRRSDAPGDTSNQAQRREQILLQTGVARVNCVDCLDRTNAAQFVIGKAAFGHQLHALGFLEDPALPFDSDAVDMLTEMYHDLGDTIALQYGGSHLVNTMETYRKINQWTSHSRDMLEGLKRYYANSFVDADKQAAINLFLGIDRELPGIGHQNVVAKRKSPSERRSYQQWFTTDYLESIEATPARLARLQEVAEQERQFFWAEYYRPKLFTDLMRHHAFKMTAVHQHQPQTLTYANSPVPGSPSKRPGKQRDSMISINDGSGYSAATISSSNTHRRNTSVGSVSTVVGSSTGSASTAAPHRRSLTPADVSIIVTSPFISRMPGPSTVKRPSTTSHVKHLRSVSGSSTVSSSSDLTVGSDGRSTFSTITDYSTAMTPQTDSSSPEQKAGKGGVRRWMSSRKSDGPRQRRRSSNKHGRESTDAIRGILEKPTEPDINQQQPSQTQPESTWTNPFSTIHANPNHPAAEILLDEWDCPFVDAREAKEYGLWLEQFQGHVALEGREPIWDGLLEEQLASQCPHDPDEMELHGVSQQQPMSAMTALSELHSSDPNLSDADLQLYLQSVRRSRAGGASKVISTTTAPAGEDPILKTYAANLASSMQVGLKGVSDAKLKAYRGWLAVGGVGGR